MITKKDKNLYSKLRTEFFDDFYALNRNNKLKECIIKLQPYLSLSKHNKFICAWKNLQKAHALAIMRIITEVSLEEVQDILNACPNDTSLKREVAIYYCQTKHLYEFAYTLFIELKSKLSDDLHFLIQYASCQDKVELYDQALETYTYIQKHWPSETLAFQCYGVILQKIYNDFENSIYYFEQVINKTHDNHAKSMALNSLAIANYSKPKPDFKKALEQVNLAIKLDSSYVATLSTLAKIITCTKDNRYLKSTGITKKAYELYQKIHIINPERLSDLHPHINYNDKNHKICMDEDTQKKLEPTILKNEDSSADRKTLDHHKPGSYAWALMFSKTKLTSQVSNRNNAESSLLLNRKKYGIKTLSPLPKK